MDFDELYLDTVCSVSQAVETENIPLLQELLQNGKCSNVPDNRGWTPLHVAASKGYVQAVCQLLQADDIRIENLTHSGLSALYLACLGSSESHKKVVELLLSAGADPDMGPGDKWDVPLHTATEKNNLEVVRILLGAGTDPNIVAFKNTTALHAAAEVGALEVAQLLLAKGGDINNETAELSPLHSLCLNYKENCKDVYNEMLDLFLSHGSDINARMSDGTTPLMVSVQVGWDWGMDRLLDQGADVYAVKCDNILVLHFAIQFSAHPGNKRSVSRDGQEDTSVLRKILSLTSPDKIPREGFSIFHSAIQWRRYKELQLLIQEGLDPDEFLQEMENAIIDCDDSCAVPLIVEINAHHDTPLGFLLFKSLSREVVDTAKYMIDKGSCINALKPGVLPPLVAALKNGHPAAYEVGGLGQEMLQYLLDRGVDIMYKTRESDLVPVALTVSSLFNVVGFFRLLQHGVPVNCIYNHDTFTALMQHYQSVPLYRAYKMFPWLVASWLRTANLFITQLPVGTIDIFNRDWNVSDKNLSQTWHQLETLIASPKSLQHLCALRVRHVVGKGRGWDKLQDSLNKLQTHTLMPGPILDLLYFRWVKTSTLRLNPPASTSHLYVTTPSSQSSSEEEW